MAAPTFRASALALLRSARPVQHVQKAPFAVISYHPSKKQPVLAPATAFVPQERFSQELSAFSARLKLNFKNQDLLVQALTHISSNSAFNNNRLSAYGSSIVELTITEHLYYNYPHLPNRSIRDLARHLNGTECLVKAAKSTGLDVLVQSDLKETGDRQQVIGDGFRSLVAALTIDQNLKTAQALCRDFLLPVLKNVDITEFLNLQYPLGALRRILQSQKKPAPELKIISETGRKTHLPTFVAGVFSGEKSLGEGAGFSIAMAENEALRNVLKTHYATELKGLSLPQDLEYREYSAEELKQIEKGAPAATKSA